MNKKAFFALLFILSIFLLSGANQIYIDLPAQCSVLDIGPKIEPTKEMEITCQRIADILSNKHYLKPSIDDELSEKILERYVSELDPSRSYFMQSDIQKFNIYKHRLDDAFEYGDLYAGFDIFADYYKRATEKFIYIIGMISEGDIEKFDFTKDEYIETDRKDAFWPIDDDQRRDLWRRQLKDEVLSLKISGKSIDEIKSMLERKYKNQLGRLKQLDTEDVFGLYVNSLTASIDPHTRYMSPYMSEEFDLEMSLSLEGIGAMLQSDYEYTKVISLIKGGPAYKTKALRPGDRIMGVGQGIDGEIIDIVGLRLDRVVKMIRGPKDSIVKLQIVPADQQDIHSTKTVNIKRGKIDIEEQAVQKKELIVSIKDRQYKIGVIKIPAFYRDFKAIEEGRSDFRSTSKDLEEAIKQLKDPSGIIIDLRGNSGGSLREVEELTGLFIKTGPVVQVDMGEGQISVLKDNIPYIAYKKPIIVLTGRDSASASEIFAAAIQDYGRGVIVGSRTFGKGTVQSLYKLGHGQLKLTTAKFYRISGGSTQNRGVIPDIKFPSYIDEITTGESTLDGALNWDTIRPLLYNTYADIKETIYILNLMHNERADNSPKFIYIADGQKYLEELRSITKYSLNEEIRRKQRKEFEQKRLLRENKLRVAQGLKPLEDISDLEKEKEDLKDIEEDNDPQIDESGKILADLIRMSED